MGRKGGEDGVKRGRERARGGGRPLRGRGRLGHSGSLASDETDGPCWSFFF